MICVGGSPVVCHGLKNAAHLNGKIGDARVYNRITGRYEVHFEDKSLGGPVAVKWENLRILFQLPQAAEEKDGMATAAAAATTAETRTKEAAADTRAEETAAAFLAELDLEGTKSGAVNQHKGKKKKKGKKNRKK